MLGDGCRCENTSIIAMSLRFVSAMGGLKGMLQAERPGRESTGWCKKERAVKAKPKIHAKCDIFCMYYSTALRAITCGNTSEGRLTDCSDFRHDSVPQLKP
jgi:hypothetical protein